MRGIKYAILAVVNGVFAVALEPYSAKLAIFTHE